MNIKLLIVILYMIAMIAISAWSTWKIRNEGASGYLLAGKGVPWVLLATMVMGLSIGGTSTTGVAQNAYGYGISAGWYGVSIAVGVLVFAALIMKKAYKYNFGTSAEIFGRAFSKPEGFLCAVFGTIVMIGMYALQIISGGSVLYGLLPDVFNMASAQIVTAVIFLVISLLGGYMGAIMVNLLNTALIYIGLIAAMVSSLSKVGGLGSLTETLYTLEPETPWTNGIAGAGLVVVVSWILTQVLNGMANQSHFQVIASAKNYKHAKWGVVIGAILIIPTGFMCAIVGMVARVNFPELAENGMTSAAFTMVVSQMNPVIGGIILASLWAAVVSTAVGFTSGASMLVSQVLIKQFFFPSISDKAQVVISRLVVILMTAFALFVALQVSGIVSFFMLIANFIVPQGVLIVLMFHFPGAVRKSTCIVSLIATVVAIVAWNLIPALHIFRELIYLVAVVTVLCALICRLVDKRPVDYARVFDEAHAQKDI